ncbi:MAG: hypothetical protein WCY21_04240 [Candidatus Cloacimonadaceae bacterium]|jgi:hypothetical protein|nr:hypothetical protein [Candidatus Cloacimonadota bacterium]MDX9949433.1 hypothetical protein [Candidatus Syntrophosphaera sp.]
MNFKRLDIQTSSNDSSFETTGAYESPRQTFNVVSKPSQQEADLWDALCKRLHELRDLKGAQLILEAMEVWATTVNLFYGVFGSIPKTVICSHLKVIFPVFYPKIEMTDRPTIYACLERVKQLDDKARTIGLSPADEKERKDILAYLKETTFRGRIKNFYDEPYKAMKRNEENVKYFLKVLKKTDPNLAAYARAHLKTRPVIRWE